MLMVMDAFLSRYLPISHLPLEERWNVYTHGLGLLLAICGVIWFLNHASMTMGALEILCASVYSASLLLCYTTSTVYHYAHLPQHKEWLKRVDHIAIYFFIAGSYTPFACSPYLGEWGKLILMAVWAIALIGTTWKFFLPHALPLFSTFTYLAMGWLVLIAIEPLLTYLSAPALFWLVLGGASYTIGTLFYMRESMRFHHAIWHLFCLFGSLCHFISIAFYLMPFV